MQIASTHIIRATSSRHSCRSSGSRLLVALAFFFIDTFGDGIFGVAPHVCPGSYCGKSKSEAIVICHEVMVPDFPRFSRNCLVSCYLVLKASYNVSVLMVQGGKSTRIQQAGRESNCNCAGATYFCLVYSVFSAALRSFPENLVFSSCEFHFKPII